MMMMKIKTENSNKKTKLRMTIEWKNEEREKKHSSYTLFEDCLILILLCWWCWCCCYFFLVFYKSKRDHLPFGSRWKNERTKKKRKELNELTRVKKFQNETRNKWNNNKIRRTNERKNLWKKRDIDQFDDINLVIVLYCGGSFLLLLMLLLKCSLLILKNLSIKSTITTTTGQIMAERSN